MFKRIALLLFLLSCVAPPLFAADEQTKEPESQEKPNADYQYFLLEPDIITNYSSSGKSMGYIRVTVELLVKSKLDFKLLEKHEPLIRDKIIEVLSSQQADVIKSTGQRENIRKQCINGINTVLEREVGAKPVEKLIFTKFLYQ